MIRSKKGLTKTTMKVNNSYPGESIEQKVDRVVNSKEPITDTAPRIYTERKNGVQPQYNIRTDRWDIALDAMEYVTGSHRAKRQERQKTMGEQAQEGMKKEGGSPGTGVDTGQNS